MLFGAVKIPGDRQAVGIDEWFGLRYLVYGIGGLLGYAMAEFSAREAAKAVGRYPHVVGAVTKLGLSALTYYLPAKAPEYIKLLGLGASFGSFISIVNDVVHLGIGAKAQEYGLPPSTLAELARRSAVKAVA